MSLTQVPQLLKGYTALREQCVVHVWDAIVSHAAPYILFGSNSHHGNKV